MGTWSTKRWEMPIPSYAKAEEMRQGHDESDEEYKERVEEMLESERIQQNRFRAIASVYETADRILTSDPIEVKLTQENDGPSAWNDGRVITLNTKVLRNYEDSDVVSLHGVNYHEMAHVKYTPRAGSEIMRWVIDNKMTEAFNMLEDQRIETLLAARYPSTVPFLTASTLRYVLENTGSTYGVYPIKAGEFNSTAWRSFPLLHGRKFISPTLRTDLRIRFGQRMGVAVTTRIANLIDEYCQIIYPKGSADAKRLIAEFHGYLEQGGYGMNPGGCHGRTPMKNGRPDAPSSQSGDLKKVDSVAQDAAKNDEAANTKAKPTEAPTPAPSNVGKSSSAEPDPEPASTGKADSEPTDDSNDLEDSLEDSDETTEETTQEVEEQDELDRSIVDALNKILESIEKQGAVRRATKEFRRAVRHNDRSTSTMKDEEYEAIIVQPEQIASAREFGEVLRQIEDEAAPKWEQRTPTGKLNINRAMDADVNDINQLFDRWYEGSDATEIEAAVLLDSSGSMSSTIKLACSAVWVIKRGLERIDARVSAYSFSSKSTLLYKSDEKAHTSEIRSVNAGGGTNPVRALEDVEYIMETTSRPTKMVFIVTDGQWDGSEYANQSIRRMQENGVFVALIFIGKLDGMKQLANDGDEYWAKVLKDLHHGADTMRSISAVKDLVPVAKSITTQYLRDKIGR